MQIIKNTKIDVNDNLREVVENAGPGDRILVTDLPKDERIDEFFITNLGAFTVTRKGSLYHNNTKIDFPINMTQYDDWRKHIDVYEKNFVFDCCGEIFVSFDFQPAEKIKIKAKDCIISDDGIHFEHEDEKSFSLFSFSSKKLEEITKDQYHHEKYSWPIDKDTLKEKYKIPEKMILVEYAFETPYGAIVVADSPFDKVFFFEQNKEVISISSSWVNQKIIKPKEDGIIITKVEYDNYGKNTDTIFILYDDILSRKGYLCRKSLPPDFSSGISLKDIMFFNEKGRMQIGDKEDERKENQLWFVMRDKIE